MAVKWCVFPSQLEELVRGIFTLEGVGWGARKSEHGLPRSVGVLGRLLSATALCHTCSSVVHVCAGGCCECQQEVGEVSVCGRTSRARVCTPGEVGEGRLVVLEQGEKVVVAVGGEVGGVQVRQ